MPTQVPVDWPKWMHVGERLNCHSCGVKVGVKHEVRCDDAVCLWTGERRSECNSGMASRVLRVLNAVGEQELGEEFALFMGLDDIQHDCGEDVWDGTWQGERDIAALGLFVRWTDDGWEKCGPDDEGAQPDLNHLVWCNWDREQARWVPRKTGEAS
jgi:hypothetical protein